MLRLNGDRSHSSSFLNLLNFLKYSNNFSESNATARVCPEEPSSGPGVRHHRDAPHETDPAADDLRQTH